MNGVSTVSGGLAWTRQLTAQWRTWVRANLVITIVVSLAAFAFGWAWNTVGVAGYAAPANALSWLLFFALLSGLISYGWQRGWRQLGTDLASLPRQFAATLSSARVAAVALVLWGLAVSLLAATMIAPTVALALGLVLLTLSATPLAVILNSAVVRLWKRLSRLTGPDERSAAAFMVMAGEGFGLVLDWALGSWVIGVMAGVICAVLALVLGRTGTAAAAILVIGTGVVLTVLNAKFAFADDSGWRDCYTTCWFGSASAKPVLAYSAVGGALAGVGTAIGAGFGGAAASLPVADAEQSPQQTDKAE